MSKYDKIKKCIEKVKQEAREFTKEQHESRAHIKLIIPSIIELYWFKCQCEQRRLEKEMENERKEKVNKTLIDLFENKSPPRPKKYIYYTKTREMYMVPKINKIFGTTIVKCRFPW
jgi:hypothetical protein